MRILRTRLWENERAWNNSPSIFNLSNSRNKMFRETNVNLKRMSINPTRTESDLIVSTPNAGMLFFNRNEEIRSPRAPQPRSPEQIRGFLSIWRDARCSGRKRVGQPELNFGEEFLIWKLPLRVLTRHLLDIPRIFCSSHFRSAAHVIRNRYFLFIDVLMWRFMLWFDFTLGV